MWWGVTQKSTCKANIQVLGPLWLPSHFRHNSPNTCFALFLMRVGWDSSLGSVAVCVVNWCHVSGVCVSCTWGVCELCVAGGRVEVGYKRVSHACSELWSLHATVNYKLFCERQPDEIYNHAALSNHTSWRGCVLQIAAISPADICYEETLSTLRYAERYGCGYLLPLVAFGSRSVPFFQYPFYDGLAAGEEARAGVRTERFLGTRGPSEPVTWSL